MTLARKGRGNGEWGYSPEVNWKQILELYDHLQRIDPNPIVTLYRAVALVEVHGAEAVLQEVDALALRDYYLFHAIRADLLRRTGRNAEAAAAYDLAIERSQNIKEREFLQRRRRELAQM